MPSVLPKAIFGLIKPSYLQVTSQQMDKNLRNLGLWGRVLSRILSLILQNMK
jgi:hypothetical protein